MTTEEFLGRLKNMNMGRSGWGRAPHKPLLLLLALGNCQPGKPRLRLYRDIERELQHLLIEFGPPSRPRNPAQPFQRLERDGLWEIHGLEDCHYDASKQLRPSRVRQSQVVGGIPAEMHEFLIFHPLVLWGAVQYLLHSNFPESLHADLLEAVHLDGALITAGKGEESMRLKTRSRDPGFRPKVILAYENRCAVCGYAIHLRSQSMGLDAAHILWHSSDGPDEVPNGLALCAIHHKAFDRGGIGLGNQLELLISSELQGHGDAWHLWFKRFEGQSIKIPLESRNLPDPRFLQWHRRQVFRGFH